jgi:hypothetical protein
MVFVGFRSDSLDNALAITSFSFVFMHETAIILHIISDIVDKERSKYDRIRGQTILHVLNDLQWSTYYETPFLFVQKQLLSPHGINSIQLETSIAK